MAVIEKDINVKLDQELSSIIKRSDFNRQLSLSEKNLTYSELFSDKMLIIQLIKAGVPYSLFSLIQAYTPFNDNDWAKFLDLSTKSLQRYKQTAKNFKSTQSEKIIEMAEVTNVGLDVFGEMDKFRLWLDTPNFSMGNMKPIELLNDSYGKEMVIGELTRINHGILV